MFMKTVLFNILKLNIKMQDACGKKKRKSVKINGDIYADRVYIDSIDNSRNVANSVDPRFEELKIAVSSQPNAEEIIRLIDN